MPVKHLRFGHGFSVASINKRGQVATMVIAPVARHTRFEIRDGRR